ncbi:MAG: PD40 domain-containing protein [Crocinitomicaceae bacterium]|nr:PD40 domain-containing protein [Crocinitomicaceae bacterium]
MRITTLLSFLFITSFSFSQFSEDQIKEIVTKGTVEELIYEWNFAIESAEFRFADMISDALVRKAPKNQNYIYRKGVTTFHYKKNYEEALKLFKKTTSNVSKVYDFESPNEIRVPMEALYYYAFCLDNLGRSTEAIEYYKKYLDKNIGITNVYTKSAWLKIVNTEVADKYKANPKKNVILKSIGDSINTKDPEFAPIISPDGSTIYFTSRRHWKEDTYKEYVEDFTNYSPEDAYVSYKKEGDQWTSPKRLPFCKLENNEATVSISSDERILYLYVDKNNDGNLYKTDLSKETIDTVIGIDIPEVNTKYWDSHIFFSEDDNLIIFASDRPGGYGGRDLYRLMRLPDGSWSKPFNMGSGINSPYDEDSPFLSIDKKSLFFSSNSDKSMGGFDIFMSRRVDDNNWTAPINMGFPVNSIKDDIFFTTTADGLLGYLSSNRNGGNGESDIYEVQFVTEEIKNSFILSGRIFKEGGITVNRGVTLELSCTNCDSNRKKFIKPRIRDGFYISGLEPCREYILDVLDNNKKIINTEKFETSCDTNIQKVVKDIILK